MRILSFKRMFLLFVMLGYQLKVIADDIVIGYIPSYQGLKAQVEEIDLSKLSHLTVAFLHPDKTGNFLKTKQPSCMFSRYSQPLNSTEITHTVQKAHQAGVKVIISIGGASYPDCAGNWAELLTSDKRTEVVRNLINFVETFQFDGIDVDLESRMLTEVDQRGDFLPFIKELHQQLSSRKKQLTAATGSYIGGMLPESSLPYFDYVSIMSYDAIGPTWGNAGVEHSTYEKAKDDVALWLKKGLLKEQLILGLPFYGYGFGEYKSEYTFIELVSEFGEKTIDSDLIGNNCESCSYITFNSHQTISNKTKLALEQGEGVMIWELTKDAKDKNSLLSTVFNTINEFKEKQ